MLWSLTMVFDQFFSYNCSFVIQLLLGTQRMFRTLRRSCLWKASIFFSKVLVRVHNSQLYRTILDSTALKNRSFDVNKPVTNNVIGYIWEIQAISTNIFILAETLYFLIITRRDIERLHISFAEVFDYFGNSAMRPSSILRTLPNYPIFNMRRRHHISTLLSFR